MKYSASFTGHRPTKFGGYCETTDKIVDIKNSLLYNVINAYSLGYRNFISGMALGVDTWAAEAVIKLKSELPDVTLTCAIPFVEQPSKWVLDARKRYYNILDNADDIQYVCSSGYSSWKLNRRNEWMVDNSKLIIAVWDGSDGGTGNCIKYATSKNKEIWNLYE